jgi:D-alanine-D-alanine ligase
MVDLPPRVRLVVLFGGRSAEHDISCISARHVLDAVDPGRYEVVPIGITRDGGFAAPALPAPDDETAAALSAEGAALDLLPVLAGPGAPPGGPPGTAPDLPTVVLPILHGPNGEDGTVQGLLEVAGVAYVGAGVLASSVAMDKAMAKVVLAANGIPQVRWHTVAPGPAPGLAEAADLLDDLGPTVFVKPANMGSSIGVHKVTAGDDPDRAATALLEALADARRYDDVVVVEQGVEARELECAVLGNLEPRASVVGEVPAELDPETSEAARELAVTTFRALRCEGMARVDMFAMPDGSVLVNEVNTIPGFTPISMYPKLWEASGLGYAELIDELVRLALERHASRSARSTSPR